MIRCILDSVVDQDTCSRVVLSSARVFRVFLVSVVCVLGESVSLSDESRG